MEHAVIKNLIDETIYCFQKIRFEDLDKCWVTDAWASGFSECDTYDPSAELLLPHDDIAAVDDLCNICQSWTGINNNPEEPMELDFGESESLNENDISQDNLFTVLLSCDMPVQNIVSFIYIFCTKAIKPSATLHEREIGLGFSRFYFMLLCVPASTAFRVYHPNVFQIAVDCLKLPKEKSSNKRSSTVVHRNDSDSPAKHRRRNTFESDTPSEPDHVLDFSESQEIQATESEYDHRECNKIINFISLALLSLVQVLEKMPLKRDQDIVEHTIQRLVECSVCETEHSRLLFDLCLNDIMRHKGRYGVPFVVTSLAFKALRLICEPKHGNESRTYLKVLKYLAQNVLVANYRSNHVVARKYSVVKENCTAFISYNVTEKPEKYSKSTCTLLQQLCVKVQEKSDMRIKIASCIISILNSLPDKDYIFMLDWFQRFVLNIKVQCRVFGIEICGHILSNSGEMLDRRRCSLPSLFNMIQSLILRCSDKATSVRTKALTVVGSNLNLIFKLLKRGNEALECDSRTGSNTSGNSVRQRMDEIIDMLHRRIGDEKVYVRKAALHAMESMICLDRLYLNSENLMVFQEAAEDGNVSVRKQVLQSLTVIMQTYMSTEILQRIWLETVLPLVLDPESSVQEKCLEALETVVFHNIGLKNNEESWNIIMHIAAEKLRYLQRYLEKAVFMLIKSEKIRSNFVATLKLHIGSSIDPAVWLLLSQVVPYISIKNPSYILEYFIQHEDDVAISTMKNILKVICHTSKNTEEEKLRQMQEKLEHQLKTFSIPHQLISGSMEALYSTYKALFKEENSFQRAFSDFSVELMKNCDKYLSVLVLKETPKYPVTEDEIVSRLFTLGECAQLCPSSVPRNTYLLLQSVIANHHDSDTSSSLNPPVLNYITTKIQAHAFITLGKLCLLNEDFAKKCLPAFVKELVTSEDFAIKNNVIIIMVDLCIRYTSLVDPYIPNITSCLKDPSCVIRRQTLTLLTQLLQEDFIKLKGSMFFRLLSTFIDDDQDIKKDAEYILGHQLLRRQPTIFFHHFVESIFHFNCYKLHTTYNQFYESDKEEKLFSLKGEGNKHKRMALYKFMLDHMKDDERFNLNLKLCQEILSPVVDEIIPLDENSVNLVKDCLAVLSSEEIKLSSLTASTQDEAEDGDAAALLAKAKKTIISQVVKKNVMENIVPIVISLKHIFSEKKSPLLNDLMTFLRELLKDYKSEIKEIMAAEKQLAKEIELDIKRFERQQETDRSRRERSSSLSESLRAFGRNSRTSSEWRSVRRHSTLEVIHESSASDVQPVPPSEQQDAALVIPSSPENLVTRYEEPKACERHTISRLSTEEADHQNFTVLSDVQSIPSFSFEHQNAAFQVHNSYEAPQKSHKKGETCMRESIHCPSAMEVIHGNPPDIAHIPLSSFDSQEAALQMYHPVENPSGNQESETSNRQLNYSLSSSKGNCQSIPVLSSSSQRRSSQALLHNSLESPTENSIEAAISGRAHTEVNSERTKGCNRRRTSDVDHTEQDLIHFNAKNCGSSFKPYGHFIERTTCTAARVDKGHERKVSCSENVAENSSEMNCPSSNGVNIPSLSDNLHRRTPLTHTTYLSSLAQFQKGNPIVVLKKLEMSKQNEIITGQRRAQNYYKQTLGNSGLVPVTVKPSEVNCTSSDRIKHVSKSSQIVGSPILKHKRMQVKIDDSGQKNDTLATKRVTVENLEGSVKKVACNLPSRVCEDKSIHCSASANLQPISIAYDKKEMSSLPKELNSRLKNAVICLKKLTPEVLTQMHSGRQECSTVSAENITKSTVADLHSQTLSSKRVWRKTSVESQKRTDTGSAVKDIATAHPVSNIERSSNVPIAFGDLLEASMHSCTEQTSSLICHDKFGQGKTEEMGETEEVHNMECASVGKHRRQCSSVLDSLPAKSKRKSLICSGASENVAELPDGLHSGTVKSHALSNSPSKSHSPAGCLRKLSSNKNCAAHFRQICSTPCSVSKNENLDLDISCIPTPASHKSIPSVRTSSKTRNSSRKKDS